MENSEEIGLIKLAGLWKNQSKDGKVFYSGSLSYSTNILLFPNQYKTDPNDTKKPDLVLFIGKKEDKKKDVADDKGSDPLSGDVPF